MLWLTILIPIFILFCAGITIWILRENRRESIVDDDYPGD